MLKKISFWISTTVLLRNVEKRKNVTVNGVACAKIN